MNYYKSLCIKPFANEREIDHAYRILSHKYQGDLEKTLEITVAYKTLIDLDLRAEHDIDNGLLNLSPERELKIPSYGAVSEPVAIFTSAVTNFFVSFLLMSAIVTTLMVFI